MTKPANDTIFALSSGRGPAAVAVVRISGPMAETALKAVTGRTRAPEPRQAAFARIRHPRTGEPIDEALALWFPGPRSETGEDVVELQLHGGRAVIAAALAALLAIDGLRPAEAGEFTRRAFENGKLDLTAVEGLADLVMAETEAQRRQAFQQMRGLLGGRAEEWRRKLIEALALVEAGIDFSDEGDVPKNLIEPARETARALAAEIAGALADEGRGERLREGMVVAIAGPPNAGKSTLLNRIARREAAIVSPYAGTTRDIIEVHLDLDGYPVTLLDTAGIRETDDPVEMEGVRRARERAGAADLVLWVIDGSAADRGGVLAQDRVGGVADTRSAAPDRTGGATAGRAAASATGRLSGGLPQHSEGEAGRQAAAAARAVSRQTAGGLGGVLKSQAAGEAGEADKPPTVAKAARRQAPGGADGWQAAEESGEAGKSPMLAAAGGAARRQATGGADNATGPALAGQAEESLPTPRVAVAQPPVWLVRNKIDVLPEGLRSTESGILSGGRNDVEVTPNSVLMEKRNDQLTDRNESDIRRFERGFDISAITGEGFQPLFAALASQAAGWLGGEPALVTRERHRRTLESARSALERAAASELAQRDDLIAEELRAAAQALGRLTGRVDVEDILDVIFRDFCVGK